MQLYATVERLLQGLRVPVTRQTIRRTLETHPTLPSLSSLTDALSEWGVETMAVRLSDHHLMEVSYPFLAHTGTGDDTDYVVVERVQHDTISYFHPVRGVVQEPLTVFRKQWQGIGLLTEANEASGEYQYAAKRQAEVRASYRKPFLLASLTVLGLAVVLQAPSWSWLALLIANMAGLLVCVALWSEEANQGAFTYLKKLCGLSPKTDCHQVVNSPAGKLFGWIGMADIGLVYFGSSVLALAWGGLAAQHALLWLTAAALPYTIFSVGYQAFVLRKWCTLCLIVQATLWITFGLHIGATGGFMTTQLTAESILPIIAAFALVGAIWVFLKPLLTNAPVVRQVESALARFKRNELLFVNLLENQPVVAIDELPAELIAGNRDAPITLTVVSNPFCGPCADAHNVVEKILAVYPEDVRVIERFAGNSRDESSETNYVARHLIGLSGQAILPEALHDWYTHKDFARLQARYPANPAIDATTVHHQHMVWCDAVKVEYTPSVFINGRLLPDLFTINDLLVHLRHVISRQEATHALAD
ncbi:hypothetical protein AWR27_14170 [Spirosoma montaniterrae]|uniref:Peptidase C39 domain-containing protein n=1 Tax=Spirosoma montaniterrae TaxID=1178516 RepID=A0A1P9WYA2_9BACT|nr:hypothetical protein AWR27_14170 [Spirosoma montaniterrae]